MVLVRQQGMWLVIEHSTPMLVMRGLVRYLISRILSWVLVFIGMMCFLLIGGSGMLSMQLFTQVLGSQNHVVRV